MSTKPSFLDRPKLRKIERLEDRDHREPRLILHDPLGVAEAVSFPLEFAQVLDLMDGTRTVAQITQSLRLRTTLKVAREDLEAFAEDLSEGGWLDDETFLERRAQQIDQFESASARPSRWADILYPADPGELRDLFDQTIGCTTRTDPASSTVGVMLPHGPPELVGHIIDQTLRNLPPAESLDMIVIVGTDHGTGLTPVVATRHPYMGPWGPARLAMATIEALERRVPWICREELRHRTALSLELAHLYLQYVYGDMMPPVLPLLCGATFLSAQGESEQREFLGALEALLSSERVLWYGSAELSHTGPAYGGSASDATHCPEAELQDRAALQALGRGSAQALRTRCNDATSRYRPSGGAVMALLADALPVGFRAQVAAYERCRVPGSAPGHAGLAGVRFVRGPTA